MYSWMIQMLTPPLPNIALIRDGKKQKGQNRFGQHSWLLVYEKYIKEKIVDHM